jgi:hypothetical protein
MIENGEPAATVAASSTAAPSCYRVSLLSGSLEISARLKSADDLDLLVRVLEARFGSPKLARYPSDLSCFLVRRCAGE